MQRAGSIDEGSQSTEACQPCVSGPRGIVGHDHLYSQTMGATEMHFVCRSCGTAWARKPASTGDFEWRAIDSPYGADTPGRPGMTPP